MVPSRSQKIYELLFKQIRYTSGGLISNKSVLVSKKPTLRALNISKISKKKSKKKNVIVKRVSDDIEAVWLENLSSENLKLFRKTSYGSFRKINLENLLEKLKEIYPAKLEYAKPAEDVSTPKCENMNISEKATSNLQRNRAYPYLSDYLIKNIMEFPLIKTQGTECQTNFIKGEVEDFGTVDSVTFPSVTGILSETMSEGSRLKLKQWKEKMIAKLGMEGFQKFQQDLLNQGSKLHSTIKTYLEVSDKSLVSVDPQIEGCWKSLEKFLPDVSHVQLVEESIHHPVLMYKGIVDCVASYRGIPSVIEWKKSNKVKANLNDTFDAPLQLCAYLGALPWHKNLTIKNGIVVVAYTDGSPANVFQMSLESCEIYWLEWLRRLQTYWLKKSPTIVRQEI